MVNGSIAVAYDKDFHVTSKTIGNRTPIPFSYDDDGLLTSAGVETISRDASNGRVTGTSAGLISDTLQYDEFGQVSDYVASLSGAPMFSEHYTRDAAGRITAIHETNGSSTTTRAYGYDDAGRLAIVTENGASVASYTYDVNSNRLSRATASGIQSGTYDDQDRVTSYGGATFSYNANGEIVSKTAPAGVTSYRYDSFGNLVGVTLPNGLVIDYILDGKNRRVAKKVNGSVTQKFLYSDGLRPIAQLAPDDSIVYQFLYAEKASAPSLIIGNGGTYRVITDHLGSPRGIIDIATGASLEYLAYDEFGNVAIDTAPGFQPYGFAGGLYDPNTHLVHFGARDYDPSLGRFLTRDPIGFAGGQANVYDYAANDPVNFVDPSGLLFGGAVNAGEAYGESALDQYAEWATDPNASVAQRVLSTVGGAFSALWTKCTSDATFTTLVTAATLGGAAEVEAEANVTRGFHATNPANVDSILENGLRESGGGRLGSGVYVSDSSEGATAEYLFHNPGGPAPTVLTVQYDPGVNYLIDTPSTVTQGPLPFAADTISAESARLPGAVNTVIRNGSATVLP
ncbi:MAG TPA: RHS repeat-associated core domain-containing protein [Thermoanaerobaculia bacterium]|nr:RHS repeat-associated core domain-containing protein [Thermoanaerobaculia bacterium]